MDEEDQNYRLIGGGEETKNSDEPNDKETAYLLNDISPQNTSSQTRRNNYSQNSSSSPSNLMNNIVDTFDTNNYFFKFIIAILLFHPIVNLMIQNNQTVKKAFTKSQRKLIKRIMIVFMLFCLIGFSTSNFQGGNYLVNFFIKFMLVFFLLVHTNIFNVTNLEETAKFWRKIFDNRNNK